MNGCVVKLGAVAALLALAATAAAAPGPTRPPLVTAESPRAQ